MADIHYVRQGEPKGLGHAVSVARKHVGDEPFVVLLGDDIMHERAGVLDEHAADLRQLPAVGRRLQGGDAGRDLAATAAPPRSAVDDEPGPHPRHRGEAAPEEAPSNLAVMGRYVFTPAIFDALDQVKPGKGGEIQLTDAIRPCWPTRPSTAGRSPTAASTSATSSTTSGPPSSWPSSARTSAPSSAPYLVELVQARGPGVIPLDEARARVLASRAPARCRLARPGRLRSAA